MSDPTPGFRRLVDPPTMSPDVLEGHLGLVMERIDDVAKAALTPQHVATAVRDGIAAALADPATWAAAAGGVRASTEHHAGQWMVGAVGALLRKALFFIAAGLLVYSIGGWAALTAVWKAIWGAQP